MHYICWIGGSLLGCFIGGAVGAWIGYDLGLLAGHRIANTIGKRQG